MEEHTDTQKNGISMEPATTAAPKNEVPSIEKDSDDGIGIIRDLRDRLDTYFQSYFAEGKRPSTEEYGDLCNLLHQVEHKLWLMNSKAQDHSCAETPAVTDASARLADGIQADDITEQANVIQAAALAIQNEIGDGGSEGVKRAYSHIHEAVRELYEWAAYARMSPLKIAMRDTAPKAAEQAAAS